MLTTLIDIKILNRVTQMTAICPILGFGCDAIFFERFLCERNVESEPVWAPFLSFEKSFLSAYTTKCSENFAGNEPKHFPISHPVFAVSFISSVFLRKKFESCSFLSFLASLKSFIFAPKLSSTNRACFLTALNSQTRQKV